MVNEKKANKSDIEALRAQIRPENAQVIMRDMKILFDSTVKEFDKRLAAEKSQISATYDRIIEK